ncbi:hypothetical protein ACU686_10660 [Yinghuangia aomiensis]
MRYTVISVDDHVVEPPHLFSAYLPEALRDVAPRSWRTPRAPRSGSSKARSTRRSA